MLTSEKPEWRYGDEEPPIENGWQVTQGRPAPEAYKRIAVGIFPTDPQQILETCEQTGVPAAHLTLGENAGGLLAGPTTHS